MRLEGEKAQLVAWIETLFQFLIGAIGSAAPSVAGVVASSFNSLLVRLEDQTHLSNPSFHSVSIPYWCDWKRLSPFAILRINCFNSLLVRLEDHRSDQVGVLESVSIPYWCDWKAFLFFAVRYHVESFNSLLVRLEER